MNQQITRRLGKRLCLAVLTLAVTAMSLHETAFSQDETRSEAATGTYQGVLLDPQKTDAETVAYWHEKGFRIVLMVKEIDAQLKSAANLVKSQQDNKVEYFFQIAHSPQLAKQHPEWMASLQGHEEWRRLFPDFPKLGKNEVVKNYPWVPILYQQAFDAHLQRISEALKQLPPASRIWLNDIQGSPSACGCGHPLCRWTADYGPIKTATNIGDAAPAKFVRAVKLLAEDAEVIPIMVSECEEDDKHTTCAGVDCFQGICWKAFTRQLDAVSETSPRIGVACFYREFGRDLERYGETAAWTKVALQSFELMPPKRGGTGVKTDRLMAVLQGWNVEEKSVQRQIKFAKEQKVSGILLCQAPIDQSWKPQTLKVDSNTVLGIANDRFTLDGKPTFLVGVSYYGGLGASAESVRRDLDDLQEFGINWLRVWATWDSFGENVSALDADGNGREVYLQRLQSLVAECDQRNMVVDVTLARSRRSKKSANSVHLPDLKSHQQAVRTIIDALKPHRNWYLDLANERDVGDDRLVPVDELKQLRQLARDLDSNLLVTASFGGHDLTKTDIRDSLQSAGSDFLAIHRPRHADSPSETEVRTLEVLGILSEMKLTGPVHHQEPFRRGYANWEPVASDFLTDLQGALKGGAAGWCFHNGATKTTSDSKPRRSFDLRQKRLIDQLDAEELKVLQGVKAVLSEAGRGR